MTRPAMPDELQVNPEDWPAVIAEAEGPQLVVAGPGTGKTEFLVRRAIHLINERGVPPEQLLVLTFSRRAAADLRERILTGIGRSTVALPASTFHSFAQRVLEARVADTGWEALPTLLTGPEQVAFVAELLSGEDAARWPLPMRGLLSTTTFAEELTDFILRCRERLLGPDDLARRAEDRADWRALPDFYRRYLEETERRGRIDYGGLLVAVVDLLAQPETRASVAGQYRFVFADEYQDTSPAQAALLDRLTADHRNLTVAADPYQSVYSFRGADLSNVAAFTTRFRDLDGRPARRLVLTTSFRVPAEILDAALRVTERGSLPGAAGPVTPAPHRGRVEAYVFDQHTAEADWIAAEIARLHLVERVRLADMTVLVRSKRHLLPELSRALERREIPHDQPDIRLVDHPAVRVVFDIVRAAAGHLSAVEADLTLRRILLGPLFALPVGRERELLRRRRRTGEPWAKVLAAELDDAAELAELLREPEWATRPPPADGFWELWQRLPPFERIVADDARRDHRAALASFAQALGRHSERDPTASLADYVRLADSEDFEATPLLSFRPPGEERLTVTTLHQAKGLEFDVVFIADAIEGIFPDTRRPRSFLQPHLLAGDRAEGDLTRFRLQEEMRLAYTAMTRARRRVVWTATDAGIEEAERRPSRFLLAVSDTESVADLPHPGTRRDNPVTLREVEALLRRTATDPAAASPRRLAAVAVLARPPIPDAWDPRRFAGVAPRGPDAGLLDSAPVLSPSQADGYETCPRRYVFERRLRVVETSSPYARFGSLVHQVLEETERAALQRGDPHGSMEEATRILGRVWEEADFGSPVLNEAWRHRAERLLDRLYTEWPPDSRRAVAVEHPLSFTAGGLPWVGRADRIEEHRPGELRVVDYKTSASPPPLKDAARSLQLGFYLLAAAADPDLVRHGTPTAAELWFPLARTKSWRRPFKPEAADEVVERLEAVAAGILAEDWTPRIGRHCERCAVRIVCDRWPEGREAFIP